MAKQTQRIGMDTILCKLTESEIKWFIENAIDALDDAKQNGCRNRKDIAESAYHHMAASASLDMEYREKGQYENFIGPEIKKESLWYP